MRFGIKFAPEEYQKRQKEALQGIEGVADDILVCGFGQTLQEANENHERNLRKLLQRC